MGCLECKNLEEAFESRLSQYIDARSCCLLPGDHKSLQPRKTSIWSALGTTWKSTS